MKRKLICFDLDNTLIYSDKAHILAYNYALKKEKIKIPKRNFLVTLFGMPHHRLIEIIAPNLNQDQIERLVKIHDNLLVKKTYKYTKAVPGAIKILKLVKKDYDLVLLSNSSHRNILSMLKGAKIDKKIFKEIIGVDDVRRSKPYPDEIFKAEHLLRQKADFIVGDSIYDIIAGRKARIKTIGVLSGHYSRILLKKQGADHIINSVNDLPKLLKEINHNNT